MKPSAEPIAGTDQDAVALVRAIRRAYSSPSGYEGVERFTVTDIHEFARRLVAVGVRPPREVQ